jgi:Flp pilus assembly protein TadD
LDEAENAGLPLRARWATALGTFGDSFFESGDWGAAIATYRKALEISQDNPAVLLNMGLAQAYAERHDSAVVSLRRSVEVDRRQPLAWINLGFSLEQVGDTVGAEAAYRTALSISEHEPLAHYNLANLLFVRGDLPGATTHYQRAVALRPTIAQAHLNLVRALVAQDEYARALAAARLWLRYFPSDPRPRQLILELDPTLIRR